MISKDRSIAQKAQEKFEFYIISLVFTLLALSIQTSVFGESIISDTFELLGWIFLLISGVAGLWRLEYLPIERIKYSQKNEYENIIFESKELILQGETEIFVIESNENELLSKRITDYEKAIDILNPVINKIIKGNLIKYYVHRYTFVTALILLLLSRGFLPASNIIKQLCVFT